MMMRIMTWGVPRSDVYNKVPPSLPLCVCLPLFLFVVINLESHVCVFASCLNLFQWSLCGGTY
jgi:hypothetical protein